MMPYQQLPPREFTLGGSTALSGCFWGANHLARASEGSRAGDCIGQRGNMGSMCCVELMCVKLGSPEPSLPSHRFLQDLLPPSFCRAWTRMGEYCQGGWLCSLRGRSGAHCGLVENDAPV